MNTQVRLDNTFKRIFGYKVQLKVRHIELKLKRLLVTQYIYILLFTFNVSIGGGGVRHSRPETNSQLQHNRFTGNDALI